MKTSAIVCALLAGSLGLGTATSAFAGRDDRGDRREARQERRELRQDRRELRQERREERREARHERREDRREWRQHQQQHRWAAPVYSQPRYYQPPRYVVQQPRYVVTQPARFYRGGYLPYQYRQPTYYVNDWQAVNGLYAPPVGHQWMQVGNDFLLVAIATGLIAGLLSGM